MITINLIVCISTVLITNVSGNMFSPFSSFPGFPSFPSFSSPFGSSYGSPFGSGYPFAQSYGQPIYSSDDPFSAPFPFQQSSSPFFTPSQTSTGGDAKSASSVPSSSSSPFPSPFSRGGFGPFGFPSFPSFPSFADFTKGLPSGDLKGNGFTVTTSTSGGNKADGNSPGQVIQTIKVEKIGTENGPGEERRIVQTIRASGPLITSLGSNLHQGSRGNNQSGRNQRRPTGPRPIKLDNNQFNAQQNVSQQQQRKPLRLLRPTTTPIVPSTGLKINGTQSTSSQQSTVLNNSAGKPTISNNNQQQQLLINPGNIGTGTSSKLSSSSSSSLTTAGNSTGVNKSSQSTVGGSQNLKVNSAGGSGVTSFQSVNSDQSATAKSGGGVTVKRVDSSGRIINGF